MKKKILLSTILVFAVLLLCCTISNAATLYETDSCKVTAPDTYVATEVEGKLNLSKGNNLIVEITVLSNPNNGVVISDQLLKMQSEALEKTYLEMGLVYKEISTSKIEKNGCQALKIVFELFSNNSKVYTTAYYFISDNYVHTVAVVTNNIDYLAIAEKEVINSFQVKDTVLKTRGIPFTDIPSNAWYFNAVKFNYTNNMIKGLNDYTYGPSANLTRGMLVTILYRMEGSPEVTNTDNFTDVPTGLWYSKAVNWAANKKIVNGYESGKFGPEDKITREQLAVMLRSYAMYKKKDTSARTDLSKFTDAAKISNYAKDSVSWAVANKIISGKSNGTQVDPQGKATRAEVATMLYSYCMNIK